MLRDRYGLVEDLTAGADGLAFWNLLRERGETLESVYGSLERTLPEEKRFILADFAAVLRTSVKMPIPSRELSHSCRHHRRLVELLEPGDYVVDFNWDSLMADALLYGCPFWYPRTGFGPWRAAAMSAVANKSVALPSYVNLFHIHGSVLLFEMLKAGPESEGLRRLLYVGPPGYTEINSMGSLLDFSPADPHPKRNATDIEEWALSRGFLHSGGRWFRPLFVPPSLDKGEYRHWYHRDLRMAIHTVLPTTEAFLVIGYSFPPADFAHLSSIMPSAVISPTTMVTAVDRSSGDAAFQDRVRTAFPRAESYDFTHTDFREFTAAAEEKGWRIFE